MIEGQIEIRSSFQRRSRTDQLAAVRGSVGFFGWAPVEPPAEPGAEGLAGVIGWEFPLARRRWCSQGGSSRGAVEETPDDQIEPGAGQP